MDGKVNLLNSGIMPSTSPSVLHRFSPNSSGDVEVSGNTPGDR